MKFGYSEYPVLRMLDEGTLGKVGFYDKAHYEDKLWVKSIRDLFLRLKDSYSKRIDFITEPFSDAIMKSMSSLMRDAAWNDLDSQSGTLLSLPYPFERFSSFYYIHNKGLNDGIHDYSIYIFEKEIYVGHIAQEQGKKMTDFTQCYVNEFIAYTNRLKEVGTISINPITREDYILEFGDFFFSQIVATLNFIKYAQVETKHLPAKSKIKDIDCKYVNQTNSNVRILSSKWFTNLVKSDGFKVRGHFRLQPYGEGMKQKKLIWINDFEKTGYTAPAQKLKQP